MNKKILLGLKMAEGKRKENVFDFIKTLVVFTAENHNSTELKRSQNKKQNESLLIALKDAGYKFAPVIGRFHGSSEHHYAVFNMSLKAAKMLCGRFEQTSFIWCQLDGDGGILSQYWEKQDVTSPYNVHKNDYILKDEIDEWKDQSKAENSYMLIGRNFSIQLPYGILESINNKFGENIKQICEHDTMSGDKILDFAINGVGLSPSLYRKAIIRD